MIIAGKDHQEHLNHLEDVLKGLKEYGLRVNWEKYKFFRQKITYCGHVVDQDKVHKTQEKVDAVVHAPKPENVRQVRSFLGLVNYYHKFLPNLATALHPLNQLLEQSNQWKWTKECEEAFVKKKETHHIRHGAYPL